MSQDWFVLTTAASNTLPLAASLIASGFEVWTPRFTQARRRSRSRVRTKPLAPSYIFARASQLPAILALASDPQHRSFAILHGAGTITPVTDRELEPLRTAEIAVIPRDQQPSFKVGQRVRLPDGPFGGLVCSVISSDRGVTRVTFGHMPLEFPSSHLRAVGASAG